jgi:endonuclease/exonuclease/phosphatase family metal-dependent hydrolase
LAKVISSIDKKRLPALVGVCEIENDLVLKDLVADPQLAKANYGIIWQESPDMRGIDCALLYNPACFTVEEVEMLPVKNPADTSFTTRDVIVARGLFKGERFYIFVNHWPSRREGESVSEGKRNLAATVVRTKVDAILRADSAANIIIMGDLNDEPSNASVAETLKALPNKQLPASNELVNLMYDELERGEGSYSYRGEWDMIDNLIVSGHLITKKKGLKTTIDNGFVFHQPFMEFVNDKGQMSPNRTYGRSYFGGVSDHFPVYLMLKRHK